LKYMKEPAANTKGSKTPSGKSSWQACGGPTSGQTWYNTFGSAKGAKSTPRCSSYQPLSCQLLSLLGRSTNGA
ncbi:hypothetical protein PIB30_115042, partial [Stylosanthes scabra]|nr:hypothetical protein [Stylosanthes scabra]